MPIMTMRSRLKGYFLTDVSAEKELLKKKLYLSLTVSNLFDKDYQTLDHPYWWYGQGLPARGEHSTSGENTGFRFEKNRCGISSLTLILALRTLPLFSRAGMST